ncbi:MAG: carbohydrate kinase [Pseudomonadota bacterium]
MILCCGEALVDMLPAETADGRAGFVPYPGGAVFNTAIALGRLEVRAGLLTGLSTDDFGRMLRDRLTEDRVDTTFSVMTDRKTSLAFVSLTDGQAKYSFHDEGSAMRMLRIDEIPALPRDVTSLFFGGISLASDPCAQTMETLHEREREGRVIMLDPNVRPAFVRDEGAYRARLDRMLRRSDIVKISDEDMDWLLPGKPSLASKMQSVLDLGPSLVVATMGSEGAAAITSSGVEVSVPAKPVHVVDTVGAGDTFNAGLLARLQEAGALGVDRISSVDQETLEAALVCGVAAAGVAVSRAGAQPPQREDLLS